MNKLLFAQLQLSRTKALTLTLWFVSYQQSYSQLLQLLQIFIPFQLYHKIEQEYLIIWLLRAKQMNRKLSMPKIEISWIVKYFPENYKQTL